MSLLPEPDMGKTEEVLWGTSYPEGGNADHLMQQYIQYLEMADRISERRTTANSCFLALNTGIIAAYATFSESGQTADDYVLKASLAALINRAPLSRVVLLLNDRSDRQLLKTVLLRAWEASRPDSPNRGADAVVRALDVRGSDIPPTDQGDRE